MSDKSEARGTLVITPGALTGDVDPSVVLGSITISESVLTNWMLAELAGHLRPGMALYDYLTITDEALTLPLPTGLYFVLMGNGGGWTCSISPRLGVVECDVESASTPAEAICKAWWAWQSLTEHNNTQEG